MVEIVAAALNPADWKSQAFPLFLESYPITLGLDGAGTVEEVAGDVTDYQKGDRV